MDHFAAGLAIELVASRGDYLGDARKRLKTYCLSK
jgi:hypothetical protein